MLRSIFQRLALLILFTSFFTHAHAQVQRSDVFAAIAQSTQLSADAREAARAFEGLLLVEGIRVSANGVGVAVSGNVDLSQLPTQSPNAASNAMRLALVGTGTLMNTFGVPSNRVPVIVTVGMGMPSPSLAIGLEFVVSNTLLKEVNISPPEMGTKFMANNLTLRLSATQPIAKPLPGAAFGLGGSTKLFVKPTAADPWLDFSPTISLNTQGQFFLSGTLAGACSGTPAAGAVCNSEWNLLGLGLARAKAAKLDLIFQGQQVIRAEAQITDGWFGPANDVGVTGVVIADARGASSGGIALTTKGAPTLQGVMAAMSPFGYAFAKVAGITDRLPNPKLPLNGQATIIATPFAISGGGYNITKPTLGFQLAAGGGGMAVNVHAAAESDIWALLKKQPLAAAPRGSAGFSASIDNAQLKSDVSNAARTLFGGGFGSIVGEFLDLVMSGFTFQSVSSAIDMANPGAAQAEIKFSLGNKTFAPRVTAEDAARPAQAIAVLVKTEIEGLMKLGCAPSEEQIGLLCYTKCKPGFTGTLTACQQPCPDAYYTDNGGSCGKANYWIKGDYSWESTCEKEQGRQCEKKGAIWYATCYSGYEKVSLYHCRQIACPAGWKDNGKSCDKPNNYSRPAGRVMR